MACLFEGMATVRSLAIEKPVPGFAAPRKLPALAVTQPETGNTPLANSSSWQVAHGPNLRA